MLRLSFGTALTSMPGNREGLPGHESQQFPAARLMQWQHKPVLKLFGLVSQNSKTALRLAKGHQLHSATRLRISDGIEHRFGGVGMHAPAILRKTSGVCASHSLGFRHFAQVAWGGEFRKREGCAIAVKRFWVHVK